MTDFGNTHFVGIMKGVIKSICHEADIIDLTHQIDKINIHEAAFILQSAYNYFSKDSIFINVIDPTVGSDRRIILIRSENYYFIAPDNGLLSLVIENLNIIDVFLIDNFPISVNHCFTFDGRDIFAPVAAHLAIGTSINSFGTKISLENVVRLDNLEAKIIRNKVNGKVVYIDSFGNAITNIKYNQIPASISKINIQNLTINHISKSFFEVEKSKLLAYIGSSGYLEIAINQDNFTRKYDIKIMQEVTLEF